MVMHTLGFSTRCSSLVKKQATKDAKIISDKQYVTLITHILWPIKLSLTHYTSCITMAMV